MEKLLNILQLILDLLASAIPFITTVAAVIVGLLIFKIIEDAVDKGVSIFDTWSRPRLYELSFIYPIARDLKFQGLSDDEIIDELVRRYDNKRLAIQQFEPEKDEYKEAIVFVGRVLRNRELMKKYILTSSFGKKTFLELEKEMDSKHKNDDSHQGEEEQTIDANKIDEVLQDTSFIGKILKTDTPENRNFALEWLQVLFSMPIIDPSGQKMQDSSIRNFLAVHIALSYPSTNGGDEDYFILKNCLSETDFLSVLERLASINGNMKIPSSTGNNGKFRAMVRDNQLWIKAIRDKVLSSIRQNEDEHL